MKKLLRMLVAVLFVFVATNVAFGQSKNLDGVSVVFMLDGVASLDFDVSFAPTENDPMRGGTLFVYFYNNVKNVTVGECAFKNVNEDVNYTYVNGVVTAISGFKSDYLATLGSTGLTITATTSNAVLPTLTVNDTLAIYNNGVAQGKTDTIEAYNNGFDAGVASVICSWGEADTLIAYENGQLSVNVDEFYNNGFADGQATCTSSAGSTEIDMGLNAWVSGSDLNVTCTDFEKVNVYNIGGQLVLTSTENVVSVSSLTPGVYVLCVHDTNKNVNKRKIIIQ